MLTELTSLSYVFPARSTYEKVFVLVPFPVFPVGAMVKNASVGNSTMNTGSSCGRRK